MKKQIIVMLSLFMACQFAWGTVTDIYTGTTIESGDVYDRVSIYDSPPEQTIVDMTGGEVSSFGIFDTSVLNFSNGDIGYISMNDSSTFHISGGSIGYIGIHNLESTTHVYGYGFEYIPKIGSPGGWLTGFWADNNPFEIYFRGLPEQLPSSSVRLHEIPEPASIGILGFGIFLIRKAKKKFISK